MYVCVCNAVTDGDIGEAVAQGCRSMRELRQQLGVTKGCGRCATCARDVLRDASANVAPAATVIRMPGLRQAA